MKPFRPEKDLELGAPNWSYLPLPLPPTVFVLMTSRAQHWP